MRAVCAASIAAAVLGACAGPAKTPPPVVQERTPVAAQPSPPASAPLEPWLRATGFRPASEAEQLLLYHDWLRRLPAAELAREADAIAHLASRTRSDFNRLRWALVLLVRDDHARATDLAEIVSRNKDGSLRPLALLLLAQLSDTRQAQSQAASLQQKLEALKALEKSLGGREGGVR